MKQFFYWFQFCILLLVYSSLLVYSAWNNCPVMSEDAHLASGVSHYKYQRFDLYRVNPPLVRFLAALPVKNELISRENNWWRYDTSPLKRSEFTVGIDVVRQHPDYKLLIFRSRILIALFFGLIGSLVCYFYSKQFVGVIPAFIVLLLWCFSPYILGHGSTIMNDVPAAVLAVTSIYVFWKWLKRPEMLETLIAGLILGLAELTKFTLLIFYPLFIILWILYRIPEFKSISRQGLFQQLKQIIIIFATSLLIINMGYLFEDTGKQFGTFKFQTTLFTGYENIKDIPTGGGNRFENTLLGKIPVPL
ncbi:MAG: glycosyltransferase family 39 protein, partial [Planctomycetaceae bacterium]|nr:glycosyltransferase family 39 protein [Planctomycetaceae bacterium]